nr:uncharacterized protein LOC129437856 [Misgurnus anguillicaudatus]XP_055052186.1 uncharacterized protein LOC129437856 [Misgurnus anguillicaudatus]
MSRSKRTLTFCATYRFVAAVCLQADVLPHLACLSKIFQKSNVNFLHIKEQVPVTIQSLRSIKETAQMPLPGSFLSQLQQDLDDPQRLGAFNIKHEEERNRRGQDSSEIFSPGNFSLNMRRRSCKNGSHLRIMLSLGHAFKNKTREELLSLLESEFDEWANLYPFLSLLASIALVIPISSVHCERDFSTMNRVKTDLRNQLQGEHLSACLRISINGPQTEDFPYERALEYFFRKPTTTNRL